MHRAILLFRPTTEPSGKYKCKVSTYLDEDEDHRDMIIFGKISFSFLFLIFFLFFFIDMQLF